MSIGYYDDVAEAETYFLAERLETAAWDALVVSSTKNEKSACLAQAFNAIFYSQEFTLPPLASATAEELVRLKKAQAEMAYYLAEHLADQDTRLGLQIQGVRAAGAVSETYKDGAGATTPIPPAVRDLLQGWWAGTDTPIHVVDIDRDEDYSVDEDVTDLL